MTTIKSFIYGIQDLGVHQKDSLKAAVEDGQFGACVDDTCKPYHLRALQGRLSGLPFTDVQRQIIEDAIVGMVSGVSQGALACSQGSTRAPTGRVKKEQGRLRGRSYIMELKDFLMLTQASGQYARVCALERPDAELPNLSPVEQCLQSNVSHKHSFHPFVSTSSTASMVLLVNA